MVKKPFLSLFFVPFALVFPRLVFCTSQEWDNQKNEDLIEKLSIVDVTQPPLSPPPSYETSCSSASLPQILDVLLRHREANGIGYSPGYSTAELLYTSGSDSNLFCLISLATHIFNNGKWATNVGLSPRYLTNSFPAAIGINLFWDWKQTKHTQFQQISAGLDLLFPKARFYANSYYPLTQHKKSAKTRFSKFKGHRAIFTKKYELDPWGVDLGGSCFLYLSPSFASELGAAAYFFQGDYGKRVYGGLAKFQLKFAQVFSLEAQVSYDNHFHFIPQVELSLNIPFGSIKSCSLSSSSSRNYCERWPTQKPSRFEIPVTFSHKTTSIALNPMTYEPLTFYFVSPQAVVENPDGSFKNPFSLLSQVEAVDNIGDAIYIFPKGDSPYTEAIFLQDNQILAGSGAPLPLQSRFGAVTIPAQTRDTATFVGSTFDIVTLSNSNLISGLNITVSGTSIPIASSDVTNLTLLNNTLTSTAGPTVFLQSFDGNFFAEGNSFSSHIDTSDPDTTGANISIVNIPNSIECTLIHNSFFDTGNCSSAFLVLDTFQGNFAIKDNTFYATNLGFVDNSAFEFDGDLGNPQITMNAIFQNNLFLTDFSKQVQILDCFGILGNILYEGNTTSFSTLAYDFTGITGTVLLRDNYVAANFELDLGVGSAIVQNNRIFDPTSVNPGCLIRGQDVGEPGINSCQFAKNISQSPSSSADTKLSAGDTNLQVQSPNLQLSGVQGMNQGLIVNDGATFY